MNIEEKPKCNLNTMTDEERKEINNNEKNMKQLQNHVKDYIKNMIMKHIIHH